MVFGRLASAENNRRYCTSHTSVGLCFVLRDAAPSCRIGQKEDAGTEGQLQKAEEIGESFLFGLGR